MQQNQRWLRSVRGEGKFCLAALFAARPETHRGAKAVRGKKTHQGIVLKNRRLRVGATWAQWSQTHQDSETWCVKNVSGSAFRDAD